MNKALLKKLLSLSILGGLFFTGCEEDDEGFNNGELVGQWEITYYYANRTRVVANPAGVSADTEYTSLVESVFGSLKELSDVVYCGSSDTTNVVAPKPGPRVPRPGSNPSVDAI